MKKYFIQLSLALLVAVAITGCKKELEEKYNNPELSTTANTGAVFTSILNNDRVRPSYWNVRTFLLLQPATYSQTAFFPNTNNMYLQSDDYTGQYWRDFYAPGVLGKYRTIEVTYNNATAEEKAQQEIFLQAARVVLYDQASQMIDLWGDIPFSEAGALQTTGNIKAPKFDDQVALYNTILEGLKSCAAYFSTATANGAFSKADILNSGSIDKWRRYANSIRLRLLMRISNVNEAAARTAVLEMINNPTTYPLVDGNNDANYSAANSDILLRPLTNYNNSLIDALREVSAHYAPDYMLNKVMLPSNDPRIPVFFDKWGETVNGTFKPNANYRALPITATNAEVENDFDLYSIVDSTTFFQNAFLPGIVITASEVNFLKAEAYERWVSTASAKTAYETALKQSVTFYYYLNNLNTSGPKTETKPGAEVIDAFTTNSNVAYAGATNKLGLIYTQKWLHFGFLQSIQAWSDYRRTNYPQLTFPIAGLAAYATPPNRLIYPSVETAYNTINYQAVQAKDKRETKIFWDVN
jgi:hypothetical protein